MADLVDKRRRVARALVAAGPVLADVANSLQVLADEKAGFTGPDAFQETDFTDQEGLKHLSVDLVGSFFDSVLPAILTFLDDPTRKAFLLKLRP